MTTEMNEFVILQNNHLYCQILGQRNFIGHNFKNIVTTFSELSPSKSTHRPRIRNLDWLRARVRHSQSLELEGSQQVTHRLRYCGRLQRPTTSRRYRNDLY